MGELHCIASPLVALADSILEGGESNSVYVPFAHALAGILQLFPHRLKCVSCFQQSIDCITLKDQPRTYVLKQRLSTLVLFWIAQFIDGFDQDLSVARVG